MKNYQSSFLSALTKTIHKDKSRKLDDRIKLLVIKKCINRKFLTEVDERLRSKKYIWLCRVIDNDLSALNMLKEDVEQYRGLEHVLDETHDTCDAIVERVAKRILERRIE